MSIIVFKPTHRCNLDCPFCYDRINKTKDSPIMPIDKAIFALQKAMDTSKEIDQKNGFEIVWHGGEPTLVGANYIEAVCSHNYGYPIKWVMQSNLSLINKDIARVAEKFNMEIGGSWDGLAQCNPHYHHTKYIQNSVDNLGYAHLLYVVTPENCTDVIPSFLYAYSNDYLMHFNPVFGEDTTVEEYEMMANELVKLFDLFTQLPDFRIIRPFDDIIQDIANIKLDFCEQIFCTGKWLCIESDGTVVNCGHPWPKDLQFGNIFDENFRVDKLEETAAYKKMTQHIISQLEHCRNCRWLRICKNRCPYTNLDPETHDFKFNPGICKFRSTLAENAYEIIKARASTNTLYNQQIINALHTTEKREFFPWKNYKSPII